MNSEIIMYQSEDGLTKIDVTMDNETVWLSLDQMAELFQRDKSTISRHIRNIFEEGELLREATVAKIATVQIEETEKLSVRLITIISMSSSPSATESNPCAAHNFAFGRRSACGSTSSKALP